MKIFSTLFFFLFFQITVNAQRFDGQWKGGFTDNSTGFIGFGGDKIDYVLELQCNGSSVTGYSYTYFTERAKRYYTICRLKGTVNKETKEIIVTEVERTKYNTPPEFRNCFQTHKLRYVKDGDDAETLQGSWVPAPDQAGDCGFGKTTLTRRLLKRIPQTNNIKPIAAGDKKTPSFKDMNKPSRPLAEARPKQPAVKVKTSPSPKASAKKNNTVAKAGKKVTGDIPMIDPGQKEELPAEKLSFEKRLKSVLKNIEIEKDTFTVQLYDNGEIDGDSVSVFYNNSLLVSHEKLSDKPITLTLTFNKSANINELTMYAENLGTIPPNTALMVVTDGAKRYEVRITSDTQKNGTIVFTHKK